MRKDSIISFYVQDLQESKNRHEVSLETSEDSEDGFSICSRSSMGTVDHGNFIDRKALQRSNAFKNLPAKHISVPVENISFPSCERPSQYSGEGDAGQLSEVRKSSASSSTFDEIKGSHLSKLDTPTYHPFRESRHRLNSLVSRDTKAVIDESNLLHITCRVQPDSITDVMGAIVADPEGLRKRRSPYFNDTCEATGQINKKRRMNDHAYPINIALKNQASIDVLQLLVNSAPEVLELPDGPDACVALSLVLRERPRDLALVYLYLIANPRCAKVDDRYKNYPLHIACYKGASLEVVRQIHINHPEALTQRNSHGETPLTVAQRCGLCSDDVLNYLHEELDKELQRKSTDI